MKTMPIQPWEEVILIEDAPEDVTEQGVLIGDSAEDPSKKPEKGIVVAIGPLADPKKKLPINLKAGDLIFYERYTANKISHGGKEYNFIRFKFIVGAIAK